MTFYHWSQTAASNATAEATINYAEGQAPSSLNDSARAAMAALAKYRDDNGPNIQTAGTSTAYTLTTNQVFDSAAHMATQEMSFFVHVANGANPTLTVDGLGPYPIVVDGTPTAVPVGALQAGAVHTVTFSNTGSRFQLKSYYADPFNIPIGAGMDYWGSTVPNGNFAFANGAALSRATYAALFAIIGTTYGVGDGSTTFNLPDKSGRVTAGRESSASRLTATYFGGNSTVLGATGGSESQTLTTAQLAVTTPAGIISPVTPAGTISAITPVGTISAVTPAGTISAITPAGSVSVTSTVSTIVKNTGTIDSATVAGGTQAVFHDVNAVSMGSIASTGSLTGTPTTPTFTGSATTPTFTGSATTPTFTGSATTPTFTGTSFGSGTAHNNVQPTIVCNYIIRIL